MSALYGGEYSNLRLKKIQGDSEGRVNIFGSDSIGHCGLKKFIL